MKGMPGFVSFNPGQEGSANERQVTDQVERLMPAELVREAQRPIYDAGFVQDNRVFERAAANQPHPAHPFEILNKPEGPCRRERSTERFAANPKFNFLGAHGRVAVLNEAVDPEILRRVNADTPPAL
jgi:hypothetical protein